MDSVITRSGNPFTKPLIVIVMMAIVLLGAMTLAHAAKQPSDCANPCKGSSGFLIGIESFPCRKTDDSYKESSHFLIGIESFPCRKPGDSL